MNERYKIGTISKLLGIPVQTLHYYEKCGFVTPKKDEHSKYRYYDAWDVNYLLDCKHLRSFDFSNSEIEQMVNRDSVADIQLKYDRREKELLDQIHHYQTVLDTLNAEKRKLLTFKNQIGTFTELDSPQMYFNPYRHGNKYQRSEEQKELPQINDWLSQMPFVAATFKLSLANLRGGSHPAIDYWWGFSISTKRAKELGIPTDYAEYIPSRRCIYTVFSASSQNTFIDSLTEQVLSPIRETGYIVNDMPVGRLIVRAHEDMRYVRYFEIWIPIE